MIDELRATNVALIREATLVPASGLTVLTGETGAGKTALLSALKLLVGERADSAAVREGADGLSVEGRVYCGADDPDGHIIRRRVQADGRGRVEVDGHMASVHELASLIGTTVDLCGQHEHQRLLETSTHVELLDSWIGDASKQASHVYRACLAHARDAAQHLEDVRSLRASGRDRLEEASFVLRRIDEVNPHPGEFEELIEVLPRVEHAEALLSAVEEARALCIGEQGATSLLAQAAAALEVVASYDTSLTRYAQQLTSACLDVEDVGVSLRAYRDAVNFDPADLERMQERMARLQGLMRTYGPGMDKVFAHRAQAAAIVEAASDEGEALEQATRELERAEAALLAAADELDRVRAAAAPALARAITEQMARLEMGGARIEVSLERLPRERWGSSGPSRVEFMYCPGANLSARPLRRIASGGEVSRVMLALKVVLGASDAVDTLVFDEVDAGVGGATALSLASVLADLATTHQVIVVTHLAQVAVIADRHYLVSRTEDVSPETRIEEISGEDRVREIARMLSGDASEAALSHAREMLAGATRS